MLGDPWSYNHPYNSHKQFLTLLLPLLAFTSRLRQVSCSQIHPCNPCKYSLPRYLSHFIPPYFYMRQSLQSPPNIQAINQCRLHRESSKQGNLKMMIKTVLISPFFNACIGKRYSQFLISHCSGSENWCIANSRLWSRFLRLEWQTLLCTHSHTLKLL